MAFWTNSSLELKRKSRFIVEIASGFFLPNVKTCTKPSANVDIKEFQLINHKFKYPGVVTWGDIKITMIDMRGAGGATLDTGLLLWRMLKHTGYNFPTEATGEIAAFGPKHVRQLSTPEKASSISNGFGRGINGQIDTGNAGVGQMTNNQAVKIYTLAPNGTTVEKWTLHNPQIKSINWGDHAYDSDEFVEYSIEIVYDWASHEPFNGDFNSAIEIGQQYEKFYNAIVYDSQGGSLSDFELDDRTAEEKEADYLDKIDEEERIRQETEDLRTGQTFLAETGASGYSVTMVDGKPVYSSTSTAGSDDFVPGSATREADRAAARAERIALRDKRDSKRFER
jgi:hypothetical protein